MNESEANSVLSGMFSEEDLLRDSHQTVIILQGDLPSLNLGDATEQLLSGIKVGEIANKAGNEFIRYCFLSPLCVQLRC